MTPSPVPNDTPNPAPASSSPQPATSKPAVSKPVPTNMATGRTTTGTATENTGTAAANKGQTNDLGGDAKVVDEQAGDEGGKRVWQRVQTRLRAELGEDVYSSWFSSAMLDECRDGTAVLSVATRFLKHWIEHNFGKRLLQLWMIEDESVERIRILVRTDGARRVARLGSAADAKAASGASANTNVSQTVLKARGARTPAPGSMQAGQGGTGQSRTGQGAAGQAGAGRAGFESAGRTPARAPGAQASRPADAIPGAADGASTPLDARYTFDAFAVGESNQFAFRAAQELAGEGSVLGCRLLFLRGGVGLGKTHLCQAVAAELQRTKRTLYLTAEKFMRDFVISLKARSAVDYKEALAAIDVLVVDDIQFLSGQTIQGEFCHVINTLIDAGKTLVVAADRAPAALDTIDARMQSRLSSGLVVEIAAMDRSVRRALLERRRATYQADGGRADVSDAVLDKVADLITTNGRDLEGAFNRIIAEIGLNNVPVTADSVAGCISFLLANAEAPRVKIEDIQRATALQFGLTKTDLLSHRRTKQIVGPRQIAMYLSKVMTVRSLPDIGKRFGGRDHTTVLHAVRKIEKELKTDAGLQKTVEALKSTILAQS